MEKQTFTPEEAKEMYKAICDFNKDFEALEQKDMRKNPIIDMAYIIGFRELEERFRKEQ